MKNGGILQKYRKVDVSDFKQEKKKIQEAVRMVSLMKLEKIGKQVRNMSKNSACRKKHRMSKINTELFLLDWVTS